MSPDMGALRTRSNQPPQPPRTTPHPPESFLGGDRDPASHLKARPSSVHCVGQAERSLRTQSRRGLGCGGAVHSRVAASTEQHPRARSHDGGSAGPPFPLGSRVQPSAALEHAVTTGARLRRCRSFSGRGFNRAPPSRVLYGRLHMSDPKTLPRIKLVMGSTA